MALLKHYAKLPQTAVWKEGKPVLGDMFIAKGTAIASFVDGKYQSLPTGNHAAFYVSQDAGGIWVMDQWLSDEKKPYVSKRYLRKQGKWKNGKYISCDYAKGLVRVVSQTKASAISCTAKTEVVMP